MECNTGHKPPVELRTANDRFQPKAVNKEFIDGVLLADCTHFQLAHSTHSRYPPNKADTAGVDKWVIAHPG
jgi:hypothetical protein